MRRKSLHPGIELEVLAAGGSCLRHQPVKESTAVAARTTRLLRHQVIDITESAGIERLRHPVTGDRADFASLFDKSHAVTIPALPFHLFNESLFLLKVQPQLTHHRETMRNFFSR